MRRARRVAGEARRTVALCQLPPRVAWFQWRARRIARHTGDTFSLTSATRPADLATLLRLCAGRRYIVELGTGTAWTTIALALAAPGRPVVSFDPAELPERERYLSLVPASVRAQITLVKAPGRTGPSDGVPVELLYIDSSHSREETVAEWQAWRPALAANAVVVFDDFTHSLYPGVREAVRQLRLAGRQEGTLFVHEVRDSRPLAAPRD